ncbi:MAG TPA: glutamate 5-kinase [Acidimicrobiales bacterium]|nr:glutamate 5-kinase [Acidimicrobiales bacterium]
MSTVVAKIGTSSVTDARGVVTADAIEKLVAEVAGLRADGHRVVVVTSGAIAAGLPRLGLHEPRPTDMPTLQAVAAVGQSRLMRVYDDAFSAHDLVVGQVLLAPLDFAHRQQYLHARQTLTRLLELGVIPVVNENDAIADDEIRFGDNDRLAALVAHLVDADLLVLLTDTDGVFTADPRLDADATLIEDIVAVDAAIEAAAGGAGTERGSGGMASKLAAARIASRSGVPTVIAAAARRDVLHAALRGESGIGTVVRASAGKKLSARKLWIGFALGAHGAITVDDGARRALVERGTSLLPAGVTDVRGSFAEGDGVEICGPDGVVFAKGIAAHDAAWISAAKGKRTDALAAGDDPEVVHRDDLVVLDG